MKLFDSVTGFFEGKLAITLKILAAASAVAAVVYVIHQNARIDDLTTTNATTAQALKDQQQVNKDNLVTLQNIADSNAALIAALKIETDAAVANAAFVTHLKEEIAHVTPDKDGPVAPVLSNLLMQLRAAQERSAASDANPVRASGGAGSGAGLREGAVGSTQPVPAIKSR